MSVKQTNVAYGAGTGLMALAMAVAMTPTERRQGRYLRAPEGHQEQGSSQQGGGDNTGSNGGDSNQGGGTGDNTGGAFDAEAFWNGPAADPNAAPSGESAGGGSQQQGTPSGNPPSVGEQLQTELASMNFGEALFDEKTVADINDGKFDSFNTKMNTMGQQMVRQSLMMNVKVMKEFGSRIMQEMRDEMTGTLTGKDNTTQLVKDFPAAANPKVAPVIKSVFEQALKNVGGDRVKAVAQTKQMMSLLSNTTAEDLDLDVAPRGQGDNRSQSSSSVNWLEELAGR